MPRNIDITAISHPKPAALVAIGGMGGSGTRVVAEILQRLGFYLGPDLNNALDNLLFTLLLKRPSWFESFPSEDEILAMLELFYGAMRDGPQPSFATYGLEKITAIFEEFESCSRAHGIDPAVFSRLLQCVQTPQPPTQGIAWKEPNSHIFLPQIAQRFPALKYIHVMRNGLDMALSGNRQQLTNWGAHFGVTQTADESDSQRQLRFWGVANQRAIDFGKTHMPERFYLLNYDALCLSFEAELGKLETFLGGSLPDGETAALKAGINLESIGRFRAAPEGVFSEQDRAMVARFGFQTR